MTNLENIKQFVLEADVETINEFIIIRLKSEQSDLAV